jgi:hypothetical protein
MHRSGTSLLARFVHNSGIDLGDKLLGAKKSNIYGHYEDVEILEFHRDVLERQLGHQMWVRETPRWTDADRDRALALISARQHKPYWGWKDPRTCLFLDFWAALLPGTYYLFVVRHPDLVLNSLSRRNNTRVYQFWIHNVFMRAWLFYDQECFRFYLDHRSHCILLILDHVLMQPEKAVSTLSERLGFQFDAATFRDSYDASVLTQKPKQSLFVSPWLRRECISLYEQLAQRADV